MRSSILLPLLLLPSLAAAVPVQLTHQGRLFDAAGAPLGGDHDLSFQLFNAPSGGALQWSEDLASVPFDGGYYAVDLGQLTPFDLDLLQHADELWVSLTVDGGTPIAQRLPLQSVPYALIAARADVATSVAGGPVDATELTIHGVPVIAADGSINWAQITGAPATLGELNCTSVGQLPQWSGSVWGCVDPSAHNHGADQITSGTLDMSVLPVGTSANTVARGDHTHTALDIDLGQLDPTNPLNHDRYTDTEAIAAVGPHYTDGDAVAAVGPHYTNGDAIAAVGPHYTDSQAIAAVGPHYTDGDAIAAVGPHYTDSQAIAAVGPHYTDADAVRAVATDGRYATVAWSASDTNGAWVTCSLGHTLASGKVIMNKVDLNVGGAYDPSTGAVTAPTDGVYMLCLNFLNGAAPDDYINFRMTVNGDMANGGGNDHFLYDDNDYPPWKFMHACQMVEARAGDKLQVQAHACAGAYQNADNNHERFYGYRL